MPQILSEKHTRGMELLPLCLTEVYPLLGCTGATGDQHTSEHTGVYVWMGKNIQRGFDSQM